MDTKIAGTGSSSSRLFGKQGPGSSTNPTTSYGTTIEDMKSNMLALRGNMFQFEQRLNQIETAQKPEVSYFRASSFIAHYTAIILILLPVLQFCLTVVTLNYLFPKNDFTIIYNVILSIIGFGTVIDLILFLVGMKTFNDRLSNLEKKVG